MDRAVVVKEENIKAVTTKLIHGEKIIVEPSGAIGLAALVEYPEMFKGKKIGIVLSGGNIDDEFLNINFD